MTDVDHAPVRERRQTRRTAWRPGAEVVVTAGAAVSTAFSDNGVWEVAGSVLPQMRSRRGEAIRRVISGGGR